MSGALVPELRFPGFEGEWKPGHAGDAFSNSKTKGEAGLPIWSVTLDRGLVPRDTLVRRLEGDAADETNLRAQAGDLVYNMMRMWQGAVGQATEECMVSPAYVVLSPKNGTSSAFFDHWFKHPRMIYLLWAFSHGLTSDRLRLYFNDFKKIPLALPALPEQQKIAAFLDAVSRRISLLAEKKTALEYYKRGVMQRLFSGALRFTQDDGTPFPDWEILGASDLFKSVSNKNHDGSLSVLSITQENGAVLRDENGIDIKATAASVAGYKIVEPGDYIISLRSFQGGIEYSSVKGICSPAYTIMKPAREIDDGFYKQFLKSGNFVRRLALTVVGIRDGKQISYGAFATLKLPYPHPDEQRKIADFLSAIDSKIDAVSTQISEMERFKKGLLQKMFV